MWEKSLRTVVPVIYEGFKDDYSQFNKTKDDALPCCQWTHAGKHVIQLLFPDHISEAKDTTVDKFLQGRITDIIKERRKGERLEKLSLMLMEDAAPLFRAAQILNLPDIGEDLRNKIDTRRPSDIAKYCEVVVRNMITEQKMHEKAIEYPDLPISFPSCGQYYGVLEQNLSEVIEKLQLLLCV